MMGRVSQGAVVERFSHVCENQLDLFTRRYSKGSAENLTQAGQIIWEHLCNLDEDRIAKMKDVTILEFADAYGRAKGDGWRRFTNDK